MSAVLISTHPLALNRPASTIITVYTIIQIAVIFLNVNNSTCVHCVAKKKQYT